MSSYIAIARASSGLVPPVSLAFWRWFFAILILFPFVFFSIKKNFKIIIKEFPALLFLGFTGFTLCGIFPPISSLTTTVTNMGIIYSASPIFIIFFSVFFFGEKLNFQQVVGSLISLLGVVIIVIKGNFNNLINLKFTSGDLWIAGAMISWAIYSVLLMNWKSRLDLFTRFFLMAFCGILSLLPIYFVEAKYFFVTNFNGDFLIWTLAAAIFPGIIAFQMYSKLQKLLGASLTGLVIYLMPIYGALYGYFFFDEIFKSFHWLGGFLVLLGIILANQKLFKF